MKRRRKAFEEVFFLLDPLLRYTRGSRQVFLVGKDVKTGPAMLTYAGPSLG